MVKLTVKGTGEGLMPAAGKGERGFITISCWHGCMCWVEGCHLSFRASSFEATSIEMITSEGQREKKSDFKNEQRFRDFGDIISLEDRMREVSAGNQEKVQKWWLECPQISSEHTFSGPGSLENRQWRKLKENHQTITIKLKAKNKSQVHLEKHDISHGEMIWFAVHATYLKACRI